MSTEPTEVVRRAIEAWTDDLDDFLALFHPDCEVVFRPDVPEPGPFHGREELRGWAESFRSAWESQELEIEATAARRSEVYIELGIVSHGAGSGIGSSQTFPFVFTVEDGLITRWRGFTESDEARAAAGLSG
jgi:ketosteroid isomerase-like protein